MLLTRLVDPALPFCGRERTRAVTHASKELIERAAAAFATAPDLGGPLVVIAYREPEPQVDRQFNRLTDPEGPYRFRIVTTTDHTPYVTADELIESALTRRTLEVTVAEKDRRHPLLDCSPSGVYQRF